MYQIPTDFYSFTGIKCLHSRFNLTCVPVLDRLVSFRTGTRGINAILITTNTVSHHYSPSLITSCAVSSSPWLWRSHCCQSMLMATLSCLSLPPVRLAHYHCKHLVPPHTYLLLQFQRRYPEEGRPDEYCPHCYNGGEGFCHLSAANHRTGSLGMHQIMLIYDKYCHSLTIFRLCRC